MCMGFGIKYQKGPGGMGEEVQHSVEGLNACIRKPMKRPSWIKQSDWEKLTKYWNSPEFLAKSQQNKKNRNKGRGTRTQEIYR